MEERRYTRFLGGGDAANRGSEVGTCASNAENKILFCGRSWALAVQVNCEVLYKKCDTHGKDGPFISRHFYINYSQNYTYKYHSFYTQEIRLLLGR